MERVLTSGDSRAGMSSGTVNSDDQVAQQRVDLRRTSGERDQHDDGDEPGGVRHAGLSAQDDVMSDPILPLAGRRFNVRNYGSRGCAASHLRGPQ